MDNYLVSHYKGKYRVKAHYDLATNDFVRDAEGELDDSFGDFYLSGKSGIEIHHGVGSELACWVPKLQLGNNVLKSYYDKMIGNRGKKSIPTLVEEMKREGYINDCDILSIEVYFTFDAKYLDDLAPIIKLKTSGAGISPFSVRNLPRKPYTIPKKDMDYYKECKGELTGLQISRLQDAFIKENFNDNFKTEMKKEMLKANQYIHKIGRWKDYCDYMKENN